MLRLLLLLPLLLAACAPTHPDQPSLDRLRGTAPTHASLADLPYERLALPATVAFRLEPGSPVMQPGDVGKQYVKGFELPAGSADLRLLLRSYDIPFNAMHENMLYPVVVILDAEHRPIGGTAVKAVRYNDIIPIFEPDEHPRLELVVGLAGEMRARARYLVIHTTRNVLEFGRDAASLEPYRVAAATYVPIFIPSGGGGTRWPMASPVGSLKLIVTPATP